MYYFHGISMLYMVYNIAWEGGTVRVNVTSPRIPGPKYSTKHGQEQLVFFQWHILVPCVSQVSVGHAPSHQASFGYVLTQSSSHHHLDLIKLAQILACLVEEKFDGL